MPLKDQVKNFARKIVENRPDAAAARSATLRRKPLIYHFRDDGIVPNHPRWPLIVYRKAIDLSLKFDSAAIVDALFEANGWGRSWRDTIYDFVHYHSQIHEVLGVARGRGTVEFGGVRGRHITLAAGDAVILPAGTGHRLLKASKNFLVVGAYPKTGTYDECTDTRDRPNAAKSISMVAKPRADPVYGRHGALTKLWRRR